MGYQSKTYSLSDEVVEAIEAARAGGLTPNKYLRQVLVSGPVNLCGSTTHCDTCEQFKDFQRAAKRNSHGARAKGDKRR